MLGRNSLLRGGEALAQLPREAMGAQGQVGWGLGSPSWWGAG